MGAVHHPIRLAVLGGGCGSLSALYALTSRPEWRDQLEITIYQLGWRLGGKGASGRNAGLHERIEEHGMHLWSGFYENAFHIMRGCYEELGRAPDSPLARWDDAFKPFPNITWASEVHGQWQWWAEHLPPGSGLPGDGLPLPTPWEMIGRVLGLLIRFVEGEHVRPAGRLLALGEHGLHAILEPLRRALDAHRAAAASGPGGSPAQPHSLKEAHGPAIRNGNPGLPNAAEREAVLEAVRMAQDLLHAPLVGRLLDDVGQHRLFTLMDLGTALVRGMLEDGLIEQSFDTIDGENFFDWLRRHGAGGASLGSGMARGFYDYLFAYAAGDRSRPSLGAGTALRMALRLLLVMPGAIFWKMQAGMGDVVFAPLYEVLRRRGVRFEFFHRVTGLFAEGDQLDRIEMARQADLVSVGEYEPLVDVGGLPCWPCEPLHDQLVQDTRGYDLESAWTDWPDVGQRVLRRGEDFDIALLGISLGALPWICKDLVERSAAWQGMVQHVQTVATQSLQLWLRPDLERLGWTHGSTIATGYQAVFDTWADMSHLLPREQWPGGAGMPGSLLYLCGAMPDPRDAPPPYSPAPGFEPEVADDTRAAADRWLSDSGAGAWPGIVDAAVLDRYDRANINPTERYVLSCEGTLPFRLDAADSGFSNLFLAGDWVRTGLNCGCVESAVLGGLRGARGILSRVLREPDAIRLWGELDIQQWTGWADAGW